MQPVSPNLFSYMSDFYRTTDTKLNYLSNAVNLLKNHITRLYCLRGEMQIPAATGHLQMKQRACLKLLRMIDRVLRANGIKYFLAYGTLLGAARDGRFIPWDDDIDVCLMRDDFNRAVTVLQEQFNHDDFHTTWGVSGGIFKVLFTNKICIDLFPWDTYHSRLSTPDEKDEFRQKYLAGMNTARQWEVDRRILSENPAAIVQTSYDNYCEIRDEFIMDGQTPDFDNGDIFEGIDWQTYPERMVHFFHDKPFRHEWIFPLGAIEFCGFKFPAPNNVDAVLTTRFGDWRQIRPDFARHTSMPFEYEELQLVQNFIAGDTK